MTTADPTTGEITSQPQGEPLSHSQALLLLNRAAAHKQQERDAKKGYDLLLGSGDAKKAPGILRQYQIAHPEELLRDGETGVYLEQTMANTGRRLDFDNLLKDFPDTILELAKRGMLTLNLKVWDAHPKDFAEADTAKNYIMPGGSSLRLEIKRDK